MSISIVIPAYNAAVYVLEAVESALGQTRPPAEVIVVDDGSTDGTESALAPVRSRITYLRQENAGVSAARNRGAEQSTGDWILFLDADDRLAPDALEHLAAALDRRDGDAVAFGSVRLF